MRIDETRPCEQCGGRSKPINEAFDGQILRVRCPLCRARAEIPQP